jgi:hypothetical protein
MSKDMVREVERAIERAPERTKSGRWAVYVPGEVVIGTYDKKTEATRVARKWTQVATDVVIVDRGEDFKNDPP